MIFLHCPTNRKLKGTDYIIKATSELKKEGYNILLRIIEKQPHEVVLKAIKEADVIIDQLLIGWYGMITVESWAMGKPVICYIRPDLWSKYNVPVCPADPITIKDAMREMIKYPSTRNMWGKKGKEYVKQFHDVKNMDLGY